MRAAVAPRTRDLGQAEVADLDPDIRPAGQEDGTPLGGLHQGERVWQETNCYVDLWIELLHGFGLDPRAALGFTVTQDFEGDQFTFFKFPLEDLDRLYGTQVQELAIYDSLETRVLAQTLRGGASTWNRTV